MAVARYEMHNGSSPVPGTSDTNTRCPRRHERVTHFECLATPVVTHASWETCICSRWKNFQYSAIFSRNKKSHLALKPLKALRVVVSIHFPRHPERHIMSDESYPMKKRPSELLSMSTFKHLPTFHFWPYLWSK